jgi:hypothetical protein
MAAAVWAAPQPRHLFSPSSLQRTSLEQGVINSLPSLTQDTLEYLGGTVSGNDMVLQEDQFHRRVLRCKGGGGGIGNLAHMGKCKGPTPVA